MFVLWCKLIRFVFLFFCFSFHISDFQTFCSQNIASQFFKPLAFYIDLMNINLLFKLGKFIGISKHFYLVFVLFMPTFYFIYTYYFDLLIFCCQNVAIIIHSVNSKYLLNIYMYELYIELHPAL